jgi:hypothetical protein
MIYEHFYLQKIHDDQLLHLLPLQQQFLEKGMSQLLLLL